MAVLISVYAGVAPLTADGTALRQPLKWRTIQHNIMVDSPISSGQLVLPTAASDTAPAPVPAPVIPPPAKPAKPTCPKKSVFGRFAAVCNFPRAGFWNTDIDLVLGVGTNLTPDSATTHDQT